MAPLILVKVMDIIDWEGNFLKIDLSLFSYKKHPLDGKMNQIVFYALNTPNWSLKIPSSLILAMLKKHETHPWHFETHGFLMSLYELGIGFGLNITLLNIISTNTVKNMILGEYYRTIKLKIDPQNEIIYYFIIKKGISKQEKAGIY